MRISSLLARTSVFALPAVFYVSAQAATIDSIQGGVMLSRSGAPYQFVNQPTRITAGDSILANPNGSARVVFEQGCSVDVRPGMVFTVPSIAPCGDAPSYVNGDADGIGGAGGDPTFADFAPVALGAAFVASGIAIANAVDDDDDDDRIIPPPGGISP